MLLIQKLNLPVKKNYIYFFTILQKKKKIKLLPFKYLFYLVTYKQTNVINCYNNKLYIHAQNAIFTVTWKVNSIKNCLKKLTISNNYHQYSIFTNIINNNFWLLIQLINTNNMFYCVIDLYKKRYIYRAGNGNYVINIKYNKIKKCIIFLLPSKKQLVTGVWVLGLIGKNIFYATKNYISPKRSKNINLKKVSVRGVAKNPVDHHNGGSSNRKPLFLNKYNNIAKYNK